MVEEEERGEKGEGRRREVPCNISLDRTYIHDDDGGGGGGGSGNGDEKEEEGGGWRLEIALSVSLYLPLSPSLSLPNSTTHRCRAG